MRVRLGDGDLHHFDLYVTGSIQAPLDDSKQFHMLLLEPALRPGATGTPQHRRSREHQHCNACFEGPDQLRPRVDPAGTDRAACRYESPGNQLSRGGPICRDCREFQEGAFLLSWHEPLPGKVVQCHAINPRFGITWVTSADKQGIMCQGVRGQWHMLCSMLSISGWSRPSPKVHDTSTAGFSVPPTFTPICMLLPHAPRPYYLLPPS